MSPTSRDLGGIRVVAPGSYDVREALAVRIRSLPGDPGHAREVAEDAVLESIRQRGLEDQRVDLSPRAGGDPDPGPASDRPMVAGIDVDVTAEEDAVVHRERVRRVHDRQRPRLPRGGTTHVRRSHRLRPPNPDHRPAREREGPDDAALRARHRSTHDPRHHHPQPRRPDDAQPARVRTATVELERVGRQGGLRRLDERRDPLGGPGAVDRSHRPHDQPQPRAAPPFSRATSSSSHSPAMATQGPNEWTIRRTNRNFRQRSTLEAPTEAMQVGFGKLW